MDTLTYGCKQMYSRLPSHTVSTCFHTHSIFFGHHRLASLSFSHVNSTDILWTLQCKHGHLSPSLTLSQFLCLFSHSLSDWTFCVTLHYIHILSSAHTLQHTHTPLLCTDQLVSQSAICSPVRCLPLSHFPSRSLALLCCQGKIHPAEHHASL